MDADMVKRLQQLQREAAQLGQLAAGLASATPRRAEGNDRTGWARVAIAGDGFPHAIQIRNGWNQRIEVDRLGAAVMEANADAINQAMRAWSDQLDDSSWWARRARLEHDGPDWSSATVATPPSGHVRDSAELAEDVLGALQRIQQQQPAAAPAGVGSDRNRHVTVKLGQGGLQGCLIDPEWAARRDGDAITAALSEALQAAEAEMPAAPRAGAGVDDLVGDALATLRALTQLSPPGGNAR
jgi:DNA-binding protein YbaB